MSCDRITDGKYDCPARMADGRQFTNYHPRCVTNFEALPKPMSAFDYRMYLTNNAEKIIDHNRNDAFRKNRCDTCENPQKEMDEMNVQVCDGVTCAFPLMEPTGLGLGRRVGGEQPSYRPTVKFQGCAKPVNDSQFFPIDGKVGDNFDKLTGPVGGWPFKQ